MYYLAVLFQVEALEPVEEFFCNLTGSLQTIAGAFAVLGVIGLGIMYVGSSLPLISTWKQSNPQAFQQVTWGLIFIVLSGSIVGVLGLSETC